MVQFKGNFAVILCNYFNWKRVLFREKDEGDSKYCRDFFLRIKHYGLKREIFSGNYLRTVSYRFWVVDNEFTNFFPCLLDSFWVIASWSFAQITRYGCALTLITFYLLFMLQNCWLNVVAEECTHILIPNLN